MRVLDVRLAAQDREGQPGPEVIFREAKQRQRRRRLWVGGVLVLVVAFVATLVLVVASGTGTAPPRRATVPSAHPHAAPSLRWQRVVTTSAPSPRDSAPAAYDPATGQLVLVGGFRAGGTRPTILHDTWVFAHDAWSKMTSGPVPPSGTQPDALAYDPVRKSLILVTAPAYSVGTVTVVRPPTTWSWTGSHWRELLGSGPAWGTGSPPSASGSAHMAYDTATHQLVFVGHSLHPGGPMPSTYVLGPSGWFAESESPFLSGIAYDPSTRRLVGQTGSSGSMWWWTGKSWQLFERYVGGMFGSSTNWVTEGSARRIIAMGQFATAVFASTYLFIFSHGTWLPIHASMHPAPVNPQYFSLAYYPAVGGIVAFGRSGERTRGGFATWELVRSR
jgi:hypothetical protein